MCVIFVSLTNLSSNQIKTDFLNTIRQDAKYIQCFTKIIDDEILYGFETIKDQWILLNFMIAKSFLDWSLIIKLAILENKINSKDDGQFTVFT